MIDAFDARAQEAGVKLVQVCGFEALPPDLAVLLAAETARERWGEDLAEADLEVSVKGPPGMPRPSDMISGGTLQSLAAAAGGEDASAVTDPAALITDPAVAEEVRRRSPINVAPRRDSRGRGDRADGAGGVHQPGRDPAHRGAARGESDGRAEPFRYREGLALGGAAASLPLRYAAAGVLSGTQAAAGTRGPRAAVGAAPGRRRARARSSRPPASGPPAIASRIGAGACRSTRAPPAGHEVRVDVDAEGHPGYLATARMLGEAGLLLAEPGATPDRSGCLTPATALGTACVERFERARLRFSVSA